MSDDCACAAEPHPFRLRDVARFLWQFRVETIGRWSDDTRSGWRVCIRKRGPGGFWANCPGPTLRGALGQATSHVRRTP